MTNMISGKGFTMIEVILALSLIIVITAFSLPIYQSFQVKNELDIAVTTIVNTARRAQFLAQAGVGDSTWGINISSSTITLFKGGTFTSRDLTFDETFTFVSSVIPSGISDIVYARMTGLPSATGTVTLTGSTNDTKSIIFNTLGIISY